MKATQGSLSFRLSDLGNQRLASAPVVRDQWPEKAALERSAYWRPAQAAQAWGCRYQTARRWLLAHPDHAAMLEPAETFGRVHRHPAMLAGQERTRSSRGNPLWRDSVSQTALVCRRWKRRRLAPLSPAAPPWDRAATVGQHCRFGMVLRLHVAQNLIFIMFL